MKWQLALAALALCAATQAAVTIDTDPNHYSAGKMSAAAIDKWFADNIKPAQFDLWDGKRERLHLNGSWKFARLMGKDDDSDFSKSAFDDSRWFNQPVPLLWLYKFEPAGMGTVTGGPPVVGWYRKSFDAPASWKDGRVLLNFRGVTWQSSVYLNGKLLGVHTDSQKPPNLWVPANRTENAFQFDVTDALNYGGSNILAVKVYSPCANGGVWQEVFLEPRPRVYVERALVTPLPDKDAIGVKAFIVNATGQDATLELSAEIGPWKSARYNFATGPVQAVKGPELKLKPGANEAVFELPLQDPRRWSPERPYLYELTLKDQAGKVVGQERFGYRTFTVGKNSFFLNDKPLFLRSEDVFPCSWSLPGITVLVSQFGLLNRDGLMERTLKSYQSCGFNYYRCQATYAPHSYFDIADEIGLVASVEENYVALHKGVERLENGEAVLAAPFKEALKARCLSMYNHPSICLFSCGNEVYDSYALTQPFWKDTGFGPYLRAVHDEFKKYDQTRPVTSSSGRGPVANIGLSPVTLQKNKGDFDDAHLYSVNTRFMLAEDDNWEWSYKNVKASYAKDNGHERAMLDGESGWFYTDSLMPGSGAAARAKAFPPRLDKDGQFDRKWLAENLKDLAKEGSFGLFPYSFIPYNVSAEESQCLRYSSWVLQKVMELERRKRANLAGYVLHQPAIFKVFSPATPMPYTYEAAKRAQQPVLACLDGLFNRNMLTGQATAGKVHLLNDTEDILDSAVVELSLSGEGWSAPLASVPFDVLAVGGMAVKEIQLTPPDSLTSGHYQLELDVKRDGKALSHNEYSLYLLNRGDVKLSAKPAGVVVYGSGGELSNILKRLKVAFRTIDSFDNLSPADKVLLLPPGTFTGDAKPLLKWLDAGGKLLAFEQRAMIPGLMPGRVGVVGGGPLGWWSELVLHTHPAFKGLSQEDFRVWAGDGRAPMTMRVADDCVLPLQDCVLAMVISTNSRMGMTLCEAKRGGGRFMLSELLAVGRFGKDAVATRYLLNLLDYALGGFDDPRAPELAVKAEAAESFNVDAKRTFGVDLKAVATMGFADEVAGDKRGGWSDQGPLNDAHSLPFGKQFFAGVPFEIINPVENKGKACVVLKGDKGTGSEFLPLKAEKIMVGRKARKLFFLVTSAWTPPYYMRKPDESLAKLDINMNITAATGGVSGHYVVDLVAGRNFDNWWCPVTVPEAVIGWRGLAGKTDDLKEVGAYVVEWVNPEPEVEIGWIEFSSAGRCLPILIAVTGEE